MKTGFESLLFPLTGQQQHKRFLGKFKPRNQNIVECLEHFNSNQNLFLSSLGNQFFILGFFLFPCQPKQRENKSVKKITNLTPEKKKYFFFREKGEAKNEKIYFALWILISLNEILRKETQEKPVFSLKPLYSSVFPLMPHLSFHPYVKALLSENKTLKCILFFSNQVTPNLYSVFLPTPVSDVGLRFGALCGGDVGLLRLAGCGLWLMKVYG